MARTIKVHNENNYYQYLETLKKNRQKRHKAGEFLVEGVKAINSALQFNWHISAFIFSKDLPLSRWAENILKRSRAELHFQLNSSLMEKLSDKEETSELIVLAKIPLDDTDRIKFKKNPLVLLLDRPSNPGNIGSIIRSCDSFQADGLIITGHAADLYDPQTIRASVGTIFSLPVIRMRSHNDLIPWAEQLKSTWQDLQIIGSSAKAEKELEQINLLKPTIYLLGNETKGLSENFKQLCDTMVRIPIQGSASSLNVACAASISLYEIHKQRNKPIF